MRQLCPHRQSSKATINMLIFWLVVKSLHFATGVETVLGKYRAATLKLNRALLNDVTAVPGVPSKFACASKCAQAFVASGADVDCTAFFYDAATTDCLMARLSLDNFSFILHDPGADSDKRVWADIQAVWSISKLCHESHPYAYNNGRHCCVSAREGLYKPFHKETCDASTIYRTSTCCEGNKYKACGDGGGCYDRFLRLGEGAEQYRNIGK